MPTVGMAMSSHHMHHGVVHRTLLDRTKAELVHLLRLRPPAGSKRAAVETQAMQTVAVTWRVVGAVETSRAGVGNMQILLVYPDDRTQEWQSLTLAQQLGLPVEGVVAPAQWTLPRLTPVEFVVDRGMTWYQRAR